MLDRRPKEFTMFRIVNDASFWDRIAHKYARDKISDPGGYEKTLERTVSHLRSSDEVFEFGCGTGTTALRIAPHVARILATDISKSMIAIAQEKAIAGAHTNIEFRSATVLDDQSSDHSFDAVLGFNVLHLAEGRSTLLYKVRRMLKPGGLFISKTPCLSDMNPVIRLAVPLMQFVEKAPYVEFFSAVQLEAEMVDAGFAVIERGRHATKGKDTRPFFVAKRL
jgi:ubiquinone/menaquinone biosynthesis C-methylase UbiE